MDTIKDVYSHAQSSAACRLIESNRGKPRKSRERKQRKPLKRQQPERKEKYRERQCRANRKQHHKLSKLSARHDTQRAVSWFWLGGYSRVSQPLFQLRTSRLGIVSSCPRVSL